MRKLKNEVKKKNHKVTVTKVTYTLLSSPLLYTTLPLHYSTLLYSTPPYSTLLHSTLLYLAMNRPTLEKRYFVDISLQLLPLTSPHPRLLLLLPPHSPH